MLTSVAVAPMAPETVLVSLAKDDAAADRFWLAAAPTQLEPVSFCRGVVAADWPPAARAAVAAQVPALSRRFMEAKHAASWQLRLDLGTAGVCGDCAYLGHRESVAVHLDYQGPDRGHPRP